VRIAIVNEHWDAGAARCAKDLAHGLVVRHEVRYYPRPDETVASLCDDLGRFAPDVVHCHSYYGSFPYDLLATLSHAHRTVFTPHDPRPMGTMETACWDCTESRYCLRCPIETPIRRSTVVLNRYLRARLAKRRVHRRLAPTLTLVAASRWLAARLAATELGRFRIAHIHNGIDLDRYRPADHRTDGAPRLLYVAHAGPGWSTNPRKGLRHLGDAFVRHVVPRWPHATLTVVGEGLVPNHPQVVPAGFLAPEDVPRHYAAADVFVAPTLADNLPYTVLEAMACGVAVVASRIGGVPEEVDDGVTGLLVPPGDADALGEALVRLLADPDRRARMGAAGRARVEALFALPAFIERHEALYRDVAGATA